MSSENYIKEMKNKRVNNLMINVILKEVAGFPEFHYTDVLRTMKRHENYNEM